MGAAFSQTAVLMMLDKNYRKHCSFNNQPVPEDFSVKDIVDAVLDKIEFREKRARTMDIDDFMKLLHATVSGVYSLPLHLVEKKLEG